MLGRPARLMDARAAAVVMILILLGLAVWTRARGGARVVRVPQDAATVQDAVDAVRPGQVLLIDGGTYRGGVFVPESAHDIVIRGVDRNDVVFDGDDESGNAFEIEGDDVTIENLTIHNYTGNGIYWESVWGYAARYVTVWNVGLYGIYAVDSRAGVMEHSFVTGAADSAYYVGECDPCDAVVRQVYAGLSSIGYSGTNTSDVIVEDSQWVRNGIGIMPNSYNVERFAPQSNTIFRDNLVIGSGRAPTPNRGPIGGFEGVGIAIAGGAGNKVEDNVIIHSARYGVALFPTIQRAGDSPWRPQGNRIERNRVVGSGVADLALSDGSGPRNCFAGNHFTTSDPSGIEARLSCGGLVEDEVRGSVSVARYLAVPAPVAVSRSNPRPPYTTMPAPPSQPNMRANAATVPDVVPGGGWGWWPEVAAALAALALVSMVVTRRRAGR